MISIIQQKHKKFEERGFLKPKSSHNFTEIGFKTKISSL